MKKEKSAVGRKCSICSHKQSKQINNLIAEGVSFRNISQRYGMDIASISRHADQHLKIDLHSVVEQKRQSDAFDFHETLKTLLMKTNKMFVAVDEWLVDPENPDRYDISPRDDEIVVLYLDNSDLTKQGEPKRKKDTLRNLLKRYEAASGNDAIAVQSLAMDNRKLLLETAKLFADRLDQYVKYFPPKEDENKMIQKLFIEYIKPIEDGGKGWRIEDAVNSFSKKFPQTDFKLLAGEVEK